MSVYTVIWMIWVVTFLVVEGVALAKKQPGTTLSANVWNWFHVYDYSWRGRLGRFFLLVLTCWLAVHFIGGGRLM